MSDDFNKIVDFIHKHHVMSLATKTEDELSVCSLFYVYEKETNCFIVASSEDTRHIKHIKKENNIAGNILLETKKVEKIQGLQFYGSFSRLNKNEEKYKNLYFQHFPYATSIQSTLWKITVKSFKMTDNTLGFSKKIIYQ